MKNLENKCAWKEIQEIQILAEGKMKKCKNCSGYNTNCYAYFSIDSIPERTNKYYGRNDEDKK